MSLAPEEAAAIRERDEHTCQQCGSNESGVMKRALDVHHVIPSRAGGSDDPSNLITLCRRCHRLLECGWTSSDFQRQETRIIQAITVAEAARRLRKATKTIYNWLDDGRLAEVTTEDEGVRLVAVDDSGKIIDRERSRIALRSSTDKRR